MICQIPPRNTPNKAEAAYWEGFLTPEEINYLLNVSNWNYTRPGSIGGLPEELSVNRNIRRTDVAWLERNQQTNDLWQKFADVTAEVNRQFFQFDLSGFFEPMQLGAYKAEDAGYYDWHTDATPTDKHVPRKLSMALMLSNPNDFEGGDLEIKYGDNRERKLELVQGRAWFFPSYTLHRVTPVTRGVRKSLVLWAGGPQFK